MFINDKLVYIELHKTGSSHISKLLNQTVGGKQHKKHSPAPKDLLNSSRLLISSIRNPWEWYVSLWSYGCDARGALFKRTTQQKTTEPCLSEQTSLNAEMWKQCYADSSDPELFRQWLKMVYNPTFRFDIGKQYGLSTVYNLAGIYTYRYLKLCCNKRKKLKNGDIKSYNDLVFFERNNCYISKWIHNESLEHDLMNIVVSLGGKITPSDKQHIFACDKTNVSSRSQPTRFFYDKMTAEMVKEKEALIINKFNYSLPE